MGYWYYTPQGGKRADYPADYRERTIEQQIAYERDVERYMIMRFYAEKLITPHLKSKAHEDFVK